MSESEVAQRIISAWLRDVPATAIMMHLICLGVPLKKAQVLEVIKRYVDNQTENKYLRM